MTIPMSMRYTTLFAVTATMIAAILYQPSTYELTRVHGLHDYTVDYNLSSDDCTTIRDYAQSTASDADEYICTRSN